MKLKQICLILLALFAFSSISQGQDKTVYNPEILDIGNCKIVSSTLKESGDYVTQEFKIEVEKA